MMGGNSVREYRSVIATTACVNLTFVLVAYNYIISSMDQVLSSDTTTMSIPLR